MGPALPPTGITDPEAIAAILHATGGNFRLSPSAPPALGVVRILRVKGLTEVTAARSQMQLRPHPKSPQVRPCRTRIAVAWFLGLRRPRYGNGEQTRQCSPAVQDKDRSFGRT